MKNKLILTIAFIGFLIPGILVAQKSEKFTDTRDGKTYYTIRTKNQIWFSDPIDYKLNTGYYFYNCDDLDVQNDFTKSYRCNTSLYTWQVAKNVCPSGWRLPSINDYTQLIKPFGTLSKNVNMDLFLAIKDSYIDLFGQSWTSSESNNDKVFIFNYDYAGGNITIFENNKNEINAVYCVTDIIIPSAPNKKDNYGNKNGSWVTLFDDKWKEVNSAEDASFYRIANYNSGKPVGLVKDYYLTGKLQFEGNVKSENPDINTGICKFYYPSGKLRSESNYIEGNRDGVYKEYYENGKLKLVKTYINGNLNGIYNSYYEDGALYVTGEYKDGLAEGKFTFYYNDGTISETRNYIDNKLNGNATINYESGKKGKVYFYMNDKMYGQQTFYNEDGSIKVQFDVDQFTDQRDDEIYPTVKIANYEWMGEYLRFNDPDGSDFAFNDDEETGSIGFVYNYETAKNACPTGWRLPYKEDLQNIINFFDDRGLASAKLLEIFNEIQLIVPEPYKMDIEATNCGWTSDIDKDCYPYIYYLSSYDEDMDQNELSIKFLSSPDIEDAGIRCIRKLNNSFSNAENNNFHKTAPKKEIVYFTDFTDETTDWYVGKTETKSFKIIDNDFYEISAAKSTSIWNQNIKINSSKNFEIETRIKYLSGEDYNSNDLIWGKSDDGKMFSFGFSGNSHFRISRFDGTWTNYKEWTEFDLLKKHLFNKLAVKKLDKTLFFYINDSLVFEMPFVDFFGQQVGFICNQNSTIHIDYLSVAYISDDLKYNSTSTNESFKYQYKFNIQDKNGEPIPGASILIKGTTIGTVSNISGEALLNSNEDLTDKEIEVSFVPTKKTFTIKKTQFDYTVKLNLNF